MTALLRSCAGLLALFPLCLLAQRPAGTWGATQPGITGTVQGQVIDRETGQPVEFATLVLMKPAGEGARGQRPGGPPAEVGDSARRAVMVERMTQRLGRPPTEAELARARERVQAGAAQGRPSGATPASPGEPTQQDGTITDLDGKFVFTEVPLGTYYLEASFIGYETTKVEGVTLTGKQPDVKLNAVQLVTSAAMLQQVVVTGEAELVENRVDKVVYNASQDVANLGGDGADVLRRVPLLAVDIDGNVSLRGSTQIQILIDGRPSTMFAGSVGEALQAMPAEQIEKVEVITSPGARYQGEGTAGIINIITKRGGLRGLTGNTSASVGTRSNNARLNLAYTKGRAGVNGGFGTRFSWPRPTEQTFTRTSLQPDGSTTTLSQSGDGRGYWLGLNGNVGAFYDFNAFNALNTSLRVNGRKRANESQQDSRLTNTVDGLLQQYSLFRDTRNPGINYDWTTDYKRKFDGEDHELNVAFQLGASTRDNDYELLLNSIVGDFPEQDELGNNQGLNLEYIFQADYQVPLGDKTFFETGAQGILRDIESDFEYLTRPNQEVDYSLDERRSNVFKYDQDVFAGYVSLRQTFSERLSGIAGLRYEGTAIAGELARLDTIPAFANSYANLLPSASLQLKLNETSNLRLAYSKRIRRPGLRDINPFIDQSDPRNIEFGNPELDPELTDQLELTGNTRIGAGFINASVFFKRTDDLISEVLEVTDNVTRSFPINLGSTDSYGSSVFASYTLWKVLKVRGGVNVEHLSLIGAGRLAGQTRAVWQYSLNGSLTAELPNEFVVESFGFYRAPEQSIQGERASFSIWSIGAQKKLLDDKWRLGVSIVEPFSKTKRFPNRLEGEGFVQESEFAVLFRSFGLTVNYKFGELTANRARERRTKIDVNDQRSEAVDAARAVGSSDQDVTRSTVPVRVVS